MSETTLSNQKKFELFRDWIQGGSLADVAKKNTVLVVHVKTTVMQILAAISSDDKCFFWRGDATVEDLKNGIHIKSEDIRIDEACARKHAEKYVALAHRVLVANKEVSSIHVDTSINNLLLHETIKNSLRLCCGISTFGELADGCYVQLQRNKTTGDISRVEKHFQNRDEFFSIAKAHPSEWWFDDEFDKLFARTELPKWWIKRNQHKRAHTKKPEAPLVDMDGTPLVGISLMENIKLPNNVLLFAKNMNVTFLDHFMRGIDEAGAKLINNMEDLQSLGIGHGKTITSMKKFFDALEKFPIWWEKQD